jgi:hypothetical protein
MGVMYQMRPRWAARPLFLRKFPYLSGVRKVNQGEPVLGYAFGIGIFTL